MMDQPSIADFYKGRSLFITGGTGFMGKVLVEKLLRSCQGIDRIYLLMRASKDRSVKCRLQELIHNQIFDGLRKQQPLFMDKITAVTGDVTLPGYGLSPSDLQLLIENVSIVFNSAATIKFNEELKNAIDLNVKGPMQLLEICRQMNRLEALVHVSTAFTNLHYEEIREDVYHDAIDPVKLIEFLHCVDDSFEKYIAPKLVGKYPNTYTYTKTLAEQLLEEGRGSIPLAIIRPSIVTGAVQEPVPGWVDNMNGSTGTLAAVGKGFIRVIKMDKDLVADIIPVDYSINLMVAVAWNTAMRRPNKAAVYNSTTGHRNPITWGDYRRFAMESWYEFPTKEMMWYPSAHLTVNNFSLKMNEVLFHKIPAYLYDIFSTFTGKRTRWVRLYSKASRAFSCLEFFTTNQRRFLCENPVRLFEEMSLEDQKTFYFDVRDIDWKSYFQTYVMGIRRIVLKDDPSTLPTARKNLHRLYIARWLLRLLISSFFFLLILMFCYDVSVPYSSRRKVLIEL